MLNRGPDQQPVQPQLIQLQVCDYCEKERRCFIVEGGRKYCQPCIYQMVRQALK